MKINTDSHFYIGNSHKQSQDYSFHTAMKTTGGEQLHFSVIADGCSGSKHTDFGGRILSLSFVRTVYTYYDLLFSSTSEETERRFKVIPVLERILIKDAAESARALGLNTACLDATLLAVFTDHRQSYIMAWGDGYIQLKGSKNNVKICENIEIEIKGSAPFYLSYLLNKERGNTYRSQYNWPNEISRKHFGENNYLRPNEIQKCEHISFYKEIDEQIISVFSDGLNTVLDTEQNSITSQKVLEELTAFKNTHGEFVHRRMSRFLKQINKRGWSYFDDISMASLYLNHQPTKVETAL